MSRPLLTVLLVLALMLASIPALAHSVSYVTREAGTIECNYDKNMRTKVKAYGHHLHQWGGHGVYHAHTPTNVQELTTVTWFTFAGSWATGNQSGYSYNWTSSGGVCSV